MTQEQALAILKTGANVFLTGEPGSGKTHTINCYVAYLRSCGIEPAITASTGIAATHLGGMTIHSWSGIGIKTYLASHDISAIAANKPLAKRIKAAKVLIIDEISMLPPYALDMVEAICRRIKQEPSPFGGLQVILVGDFFQLPPVSKTRPEPAQTALLGELDQRFAYGSRAWEAADPVVCYLGEQFRQDDAVFLSLLTAIRANNFGPEHLAHLNQRQIDYSEAPADLPKLYSHNVDVDRVNAQMLAKLPGRQQAYQMTGQGARPLVDGLKRGCLSPEVLELKIGAAVMFTKNSPKGNYANGTLGTVAGFAPGSNFPIIKINNGFNQTVEPSDWVLEEGGETLARITQFPLRLAWAITVHKSQGMSLDAAVMDLSSVFEYGQGYVALSRVRRLSGLHLLGYNERAFEVHPDIVAKDEQFRVGSANGLAGHQMLSSEELAAAQADFLKSCGGRAGAGPLITKKELKPKAPKSDTCSETLVLWQSGKTLVEIATARSLVNSTIIGHLEQLVDDGRIKTAELQRIMPLKIARALPTIHQAFRKAGGDKLAPVFTKLKGKYSFEELRLARLAMPKKVN
jgi:ATP-dependent exoDNAse (exonuclease V) alpha subunit